MLKEDSFLDESLENLSNDCYSVKVLESTVNKIKMLRNIEDKAGISRLDIKYKNGFYDIPDDEYNAIKRIFRTVKAKPSNPQKFRELYIFMVKHIIGNELILSKKSSKRDENGKQLYNYELDEFAIQYHLDLNKFKNNKGSGFDQYFINRFNIENVIDKQTEFLSDDQ